MFWTIAIAVVAVLAVIGWWSGRRSTATVQQLERRRRQLGIHDGKGMGGWDR